MREWKTKAAAVLALLLVALLPGVGAAREPAVLRLNLAEDPPQLDSTRSTDQVSFFVLGHVMEGLTRYGKGGDIVPGVAERWELGEKGATFYLRPGARWADGKRVTAHDFVYA